MSSPIIALMRAVRSRIGAVRSCIAAGFVLVGCLLLASSGGAGAQPMQTVNLPLIGATNCAPSGAAFGGMLPITFGAPVQAGVGPNGDLTFVWSAPSGDLAAYWDRAFSSAFVGMVGGSGGSLQFIAQRHERMVDTLTLRNGQPSTEGRVGFDITTSGLTLVVGGLPPSLLVGSPNVGAQFITQQLPSQPRICLNFGTDANGNPNVPLPPPQVAQVGTTPTDTPRQPPIQPTPAVQPPAPTPESGGGATPARPKLTITKTANTDRITPGDIITYTITVTNPADMAAENVIVEDAGGSGLVILSVQSDDGVCNAKTKECVFQQIAAHGSATITVTAYVTDPALAGTAVTNNANVRYGDADPRDPSQFTITFDNKVTVTPVSEKPTLGPGSAVSNDGTIRIVRRCQVTLTLVSLSPSNVTNGLRAWRVLPSVTFGGISANTQAFITDATPSGEAAPDGSTPYNTVLFKQYVPISAFDLPVMLRTSLSNYSQSSPPGNPSPIFIPAPDNPSPIIMPAPSNPSPIIMPGPPPPSGPSFAGSGEVTFDTTLPCPAVAISTYEIPVRAPGARQDEPPTMVTAVFRWDIQYVDDGD